MVDEREGPEEAARVAAEAAKENRRYLREEFRVHPSLEKFSSLAELMNFVARYGYDPVDSTGKENKKAKGSPSGTRYLGNPSIGNYDFWMRTAKFYTDGMVWETRTDDYDKFEKHQADSYPVTLRAVTKGISVFFIYPSHIKRRN